MCSEAGAVKLDFSEDVTACLVKAIAVLAKHVHPVVDLSLVVVLCGCHWLVSFDIDIIRHNEPFVNRP